MECYCWKKAPHPPWSSLQTSLSHFIRKTITLSHLQHQHKCFIVFAQMNTAYSAPQLVWVVTRTDALSCIFFHCFLFYVSFNAFLLLHFRDGIWQPDLGLLAHSIGNICSCFKQRICLLSGMLNNNNSTTADQLGRGNENHRWARALEGHSRQNVIK